MGYNTRFHLELEGNTEEIESLMKKYKGYSNCSNLYYISALLKYDECEAKWYDHENDFVALSERYLEITFKLSGIGENWGDFWIKVFKNGKFKKYDCILYNKEIQ